MPSPSDDTEQFAATPPSATQPRHAARSGAAPISRAGWWALTIAAAVLLILGFLLTFGPARYWTPVPAVFLGYFLISGVIGLVFWKGVRELRDSNPTLHTGDGPASPGARVAAAVGAVGIASALVLLPAGLSDAPANALPCPDGSNTCGPTAPTLDQGPTQGGGNTTAPQAPATTIPGYTPPEMPTQPQGPNTPTFQGTVQAMPTPDKVDPNSCIFNCDAGRPTPPPQTGQANPPQNGQQQAPQTGQNPVTTAPQTVATTPPAPTSTPQLRTPTVETTTTTSQSGRDRESNRDNEDEKNSGIPYQAAEIAALAGTYRRRKQEAGPAPAPGAVGVPLAGPSNEVGNFEQFTDDSATVVSNYQTVAFRGPDRPGGSSSGSGGDVSTGVGTQIPGAPKWTPHDPATPYATQPLISRGDDIAYKATVEHALLVISHIWPHSADMIEHFFSNTGDDKTVDPTTLMQDIPEFKTMVSQAIEREARTAVARAAEKGISGPVPFRTGWIGFYPDPEAYPDWYHAIGGFDFSVGGVATISGDTISIRPQVDIADFYNWDGGKKTKVGPLTIHDADMKDLVTAGVAKEFLITGSSQLPNITIPK